MNRSYRLVLLGMSVVSLFFALGFFLQVPWVVRLWPLESGRLSNIFLSSILAAIGAPILWIALSGETRAAAGGAINLALSSIGFAGMAFLLYFRDPRPGLLLLGLFALALLVFCIGLIFFSARFMINDTRPTPGLVRFSFAAFSLMLLAVGAALVLGRPNILPWPVSPENSVFYGWIFLGAMCYFLYGLIFPVWGNARGQLLGFLAYDLILIGPFLLHFNAVRPEARTSLVVYTLILVYSGLVAVYFLFIHRATRFNLRRSPGVQVPTRA